MPVVRDGCQAPTPVTGSGDRPGGAPVTFARVVRSEIAQAFRDHAQAYDRYEAFVSQSFCKLSYRIERESDFAIHAQVQSADGFMIGRFSTRAGRGELIRTRAAINQDGQDRFAIYLPLRGGLEVQQLSRTARCAPGSIMFVNMAEPFVQRKLGDNDTVYFFMPRSFVEQRLLRDDAWCGRSLAAESGLPRLVSESVAAFQRDAAEMSDLDFVSAARLLGELVLLSLCGAADAGSDLSPVRARNLARAKRIIRARLSNADLRIGDIARECGISVRYLHELFRGEGASVYEYLKRQRLQRARSLLESHGDAVSVTEVGLCCGFANASQFSTAFRLAFALSPRDVKMRMAQLRRAD